MYTHDVAGVQEDLPHRTNLAVWHHMVVGSVVALGMLTEAAQQEPPVGIPEHSECAMRDWSGHAAV